MAFPKLETIHNEFPGVPVRALDFFDVSNSFKTATSRRNYIRGIPELSDLPQVSKI